MNVSVCNQLTQGQLENNQIYLELTSLLRFPGKDFVKVIINQNSFCDIRENTPKSYGMGLSPPPHTEKVCSFVTFPYGWLPLKLMKE